MARSSALMLLVLAAALGGAKPARPKVVEDPFSPGDLFSDKSVVTELEAAEKALDAELGRIPKRPRILLSSREFAFQRALADQRELLKKMYPGADESQIRAEAAQVALGAFAFYEPDTNTVHILPDNFVAAARGAKDPQFLQKEFLRMVMVHELCHAYDKQEKGLDAMRQTLKGPDQAKIYSALSEGHAQFVTSHAMKRMNRMEDFQKFSDAAFSSAHDDDPGTQYLNEVHAASGRFGYVQGLLFYQALEERGGAEAFLAAPFKQLPASVSVILHPERLMDPGDRPLPLDLAPAVKNLVLSLQPSWAIYPMPADEHILRSKAEPLLDKAKVDSLLEGFVAGAAFTALPPPPKSKAQLEAALKKREHGAPKSMTCEALQMDSPDSAKHLLGMLRKRDLAEEALLTTRFKTTELKDGSLKVKGDLPNFRRSVLVDSGKQATGRITVMFQRESVVAGCGFQASPFEDDVLSDLVDAFAGELAKLPPVKQAPAREY